MYIYYDKGKCPPGSEKLTNHTHPIPKLRTSTPSLPEYFLMVWCLIKQEIHIHGVVLS